MGRSYKIRCEHCGTEFIHFEGQDLGTMRMCVGCECHLETENAIRCPGCMRKLNNTVEEFNRQVQTIMSWD